MLNIISLFGVFTGLGYLILKTEEKEKIRKAIRQAIYDNHPLLLSIESERYKKIGLIDKGSNDIFEDDAYEKKIKKDEINKEYNTLINKAIDKIENSKDEIEKVKKILEQKELDNKYWEEYQIKEKTKSELIVIKYAEDVYCAFDGYQRLNKNDFKNRLMKIYPFSSEKFDIIYSEITRNIYGIVEECYDEQSEYVIKRELQKKPDEKDEKYNRLIVYYDEWKLKNNKINNENEEILKNKKIRIQNIDNYGPAIKEIFVGYDCMTKLYFKNQLQLKLNVTEIESNDLLHSLLNEETGLIEEDLDNELCIVIGSDYKSS